MAAKTITFIDPYGKARVVPESDEQKVTAAGWRPAVKMNDPTGKARWVPESDLPKVTAAGWKPVSDAPPESNAVQRAYDRFIAPISGNEHAGVALDAIQNFARHTAMAAHPIFHPQEDATALLKSAYEEDPLVVAQKMHEGYKQNGWRGAVDAYEDTAKNSTIGKMIGGTAKDFKDNGVVQGTAGLAGDVAGAYLGGKAVEGAAGAVKPVSESLSKGAQTLKDATTKRANSAANWARPQPASMTAEELAAQKLVKAMTPDEAAVPSIKSASSEVSDALAAAKRNGTKINSKLDAAKALRDRGAEVQAHYTEKLMRPHSGKFQTVPDEYNGEMSGNGKNQATIGQLNDRVDAINRELKSNFRKKLKSQTTEANASDADLLAEKSKLTKILHQSLGDMNGLQPEDIADVRQRAGKLRGLADEMESSANKDTVSAGRQSAGSSFSPSKSGLADKAIQKIRGGQEIIGNRAINDALSGFSPEEKPLPEPKLPDPSTTATTPEAAQQEFLRAHELEQQSQDAAAARNAEANRLREQNINTQRDAAQQEASHASDLENKAQDASATRRSFVEQTRQRQAAANKTSADQEFLKSNDLDQAAQDASASRSALADEARRGNAAASYEQRTGRPAPDSMSNRVDQFISQPTPTSGQSNPPVQLPPASADVSTATEKPAASAPTTVIPPSPKPIPLPTPMVDKEVVAADPSRGVKPVNLQVIDAAPQTHVFSKSLAKAANPNIDVEEAAKTAAKAGFEVQE